MPASLFRRALAWSNLFEAWLKVRGNMGGPGIDGVTIEAFEHRLEERLREMQKSVLSGEYRPLPLLAWDIEKEDGGTRRLAIPTVGDRVLQCAVALVLTPILEAEFEDCSFAYRRGRSVRQAVARVERYRDEGFRWVVDADISGYFDHIDHPRLLAELRRLVSDARLIDLVALWVRSEVSESGRIRRVTKGIAQGSPLSPLLANLYLDRLDEAILDDNLRLVRFADDFVILCRSRERAEEALELTGAVLEQLRLRLNDAKTRIVDFNQGFRFLGVEFVRTLAVPAPRDGRARTPRSQISLSAPDNHREAAPEKSGKAGASLPPDTALAHAFRRTELDATSFLETFESASASPQTESTVDAAATESHVTTVPSTASPSSSESTVPTGADPLLRTLYVLEQGCHIHREGERLSIVREGNTVESVPVASLDLVFIFGNSSLTTPAAHLCLLEGVRVVFLSAIGRYYGTLDAGGVDTAAVHRTQLARAADHGFTLDLAKAFVRGKLGNARRLVRNLARHRASSTLRERQLALRESVWRIKTASSVDELRGIEGSAARNYFAAFQEVLPDAWGFIGRNRQPPRDPINVLLSFGYTLLARNVHALLCARRLHPMVGFLHPAREGHAALVSDLMEEFRPLVVDALVLDLALRRRLTPDDFVCDTDADTPCRARPAALRSFIHAFEHKMRSGVRHPGSAEPLDYRRLIDRQAIALVRALRDDAAPYFPMLLR